MLLHIAHFDRLVAKRIIKHAAKTVVVSNLVQKCLCSGMLAFIVLIVLNAFDKNWALLLCIIDGKLKAYSVICIVPLGGPCLDVRSFHHNVCFSSKTLMNANRKSGRA